MCLALFSRQFNLKALFGVIPHTGVTEPVSKALPRRVNSLVIKTDQGRVISDLIKVAFMCTERTVFLHMNNFLNLLL